MSELKNQIPHYQEINDFLAALPSGYRTPNPLFYCLRLRQNDAQLGNYKPPFRKDFYFLGMVSNAGETKITYDHTNVTDLSAFLVFQSPGLIYSFYRDSSANGYLIYFKKDLFSFFKQDIEIEFPFFNILHTNFFKLNQTKFREFAPYFEAVFSAYESPQGSAYKIAALKLLALLYELKEYTAAFSQWQEGFSTPQQLLFERFVRLVNNFYIEKRTIEEYAEMLHITPNHLSQTVKKATGKKALTFITERLLNEAKNWIQFTHHDMAEIAFQLNFSDPANFGKFFKKHTQLTPLEYRNRHSKL